MPEEAVFLVENQLAVLVDDVNAHRTPSLKDLQHWNAERTAAMKLQISAAEAKQQKTNEHALSEEALRRRREREERRTAAAKTKALAENLEAEDLFDTASGSGQISVPPLVAEEQSSTTSNAKLPTPAYTITLPASSSSLQWYETEGSVYETIGAARAAGVWSYPADLHERAKCGVFKDLWEKGNFMGGGIKFGGDFLVYPGDPLRYHSHFVATVIDSPISTLNPMEVVAHGRLGTATKKAHLLCGWDDDKHEVSYFSIEWAGFG